MSPSRQQRRARARGPKRGRRGGARLFLAFMVVVLIGGVALIYWSRLNPPPLTRGASAGEHWHASLKIFICGKQMTNYPTLEGEIHSHGDGFIHIHPSTPAGTGDNATLGTFLRLYETDLSESQRGQRSLTFPDGKTYKDGDRCPKSKTKRNLVVTNKGETIEGDPGNFILHDGDAIVIKFGPEGDKTFPNPYAKEKGIPDPGGTPGATPAPDDAQPPQQPPPQMPIPTGADEPEGSPEASPDDAE